MLLRSIRCIAPNAIMFNAAGLVGNLHPLGSLITSSHDGKESATSTYANISRAALSPIVPTRATRSIFLVIWFRLATILLALASERGDTNERRGFLGSKMYGLSVCVGSLYVASAIGKAFTHAITSASMPLFIAQLPQLSSSQVPSALNPACGFLTGAITMRLIL